MRDKRIFFQLNVLLALLVAQSLFAQDDSDTACRLSTMPKNNSTVQISSSGDTKRIAISTNNSVCVWVATSDSAWLSVNPDSGMGSDFVNVSSEPNRTNKPRKATVTFVGSDGNTASSVTFTQDIAYTACSISVSTERQPFLDYSGGSGAITVHASDRNCRWSALSNIYWITLSSGTSGKGDGTVYYTILVNNGPNSRRGNIIIADKSIVINQEGRPQESSNRTYTPATKKTKKSSDY